MTGPRGVTSRHYTPGCEGWVLRDEVRYPAPRGLHVSWWYGPDHGFGTTYGSLGYSTAVFPTRLAAEEAYRTIYGKLRRTGTRNQRAQRVADAEAEQAAMIAAYEARKAATS